MSLTESGYGERFFEIDKWASQKIEMDNARRQYMQQVADKEVNPQTETFDQWFDAGNYDPTDW